MVSPSLRLMGQLQEIRAVQLSTEARLDALFERIGSLEAAVDSIDQSNPAIGAAKFGNFQLAFLS